MAPSIARDRDAGMRRISAATRWLAVGGFVLTGAFYAFFSGRASSAAHPASGASTATATVPSDGGASDSGSRATPTLPPDTYAPQPRRHTATRGS